MQLHSSTDRIAPADKQLLERSQVEPLATYGLPIVGKAFSQKRKFEYSYFNRKTWNKIVFVDGIATSMETIAIVGGGASGILAAVHLARLAAKPCRILLIDPASELAGGPAFSTDDPQHVLNAPARLMSAFDDDPEHFVRWLGSGGTSYGSNDFVPRRLYRLYLQDVLSEVQRERPGGSTISWVRERIVDIHPWDDLNGRSMVLRAETGPAPTAGYAILAIGAPEPCVLDRFGVSGPLVVNNPWSPQALEDVPLQGDVFIVGTGLTTVDVVLALAAGRRSLIHAAISPRICPNCPPGRWL